MKLVFSDFKKGEVKVKVTNLDDLWYLSQIIEPKDIVMGETTRKIRVGEGERQESVKKTVFLKINVEKTEFSKQSNTLRVSGIVIEGPEDVPKGSHHTFSVEINEAVTIIKEHWYDFQIEKLKEASSEKQPSVMLVVFDNEEAHFAFATSYGYEYLSELKGNVSRKEDEKQIESTFYGDLVKKIKEYVDRYKIERVVLASPAFWKDYVVKRIEPELKKKIIIATCSSADKTAFNEVLKRPEVETALKESRAVEEIMLVEELLKEILAGKLAKYGFEAVSKAVEIGAVRIILITDSYIRKTREENIFEKVDKILKDTDRMKGKVKIISSEHEGGKQLDGLGGIAALLRYQID